MSPKGMEWILMLFVCLPCLTGAQSAVFLSEPAVQNQTLQGFEKMELRLHPFSKDYLKSFAQDGWGILKAPASWNGKNWGRLALSGAFVAVAVSADQDLKRIADRYPKYALPLNVTNGFGNGLITLPIAGVIWLEGRYRNNQHTQLVGLNVAKAFVLSRVMVQVPKYVFQRYRPVDAPGDPLLFDGPFGRYTHNSFPSGHVTSAFAAAAVFRRAYMDEHRWVPITFYTVALAVGAGRLVQGQHWFSDVIAGAILGQVVGDYVAKKGVTRFEVAGNGMVFRF